MRAFVVIVGLALVASSAACTRHVPSQPASELREPGAPSVTVATAADAADGDASDGGDGGDGRALAGYPELLELLDGKEKLGFVSVPLGAREPRPIMIAIHGGSEKPEVACRAWRAITEGFPFLVCPRGFGGRESALGWRSTSDTASRIARAVAATKATFGSGIMETTSMVLAGFSMGGSQVALLARSDPKTYRRIVIGDSAHDPHPALTFSRVWAREGGERVVFLCTTSGCEPSMRAAARNVATLGVPARLNIAATQVHGLSERAGSSMRRDLPWVVEGAPGWESHSPSQDASLPGKTETFAPK
jgi:pimeloyl-ACP methyl ester carboxylesterase